MLSKYSLHTKHSVPNLKLGRKIQLTRCQGREEFDEIPNHIAREMRNVVGASVVCFSLQVRK
jgi:hypothetical protein